MTNKFTNFFSRWFWQSFPETTPKQDQLCKVARSSDKDEDTILVATYKLERFHDGIDYGSGFVAGISGIPLTDVYFWKAL